jgi:hypothetical protein
VELANEFGGTHIEGYVAFLGPLDYIQKSSTWSRLSIGQRGNGLSRLLLCLSSLRSGMDWHKVFALKHLRLRWLAVLGRWNGAEV